MDELLILDAALTVCAGKVPAHLITELRAWLDAQLDVDGKYPEFGMFLDAQKKAVEALASHPALFGD